MSGTVPKAIVNELKNKIRLLGAEIDQLKAALSTTPPEPERCAECCRLNVAMGEALKHIHHNDPRGAGEILTSALSTTSPEPEREGLLREAVRLGDFLWAMTVADHAPAEAARKQWSDFTERLAALADANPSTPSGATPPEPEQPTRADVIKEVFDWLERHDGLDCLDTEDTWFRKFSDHFRGTTPPEPELEMHDGNACQYRARVTSDGEYLIGSAADPSTPTGGREG